MTKGSVEDVSIVEFLRARLDEDERVAKAATPGPWRWLPPSGESFPQSDEELIGAEGEWYACEFYCRWGPGDVTSRGKQGQPGHEHLRHEVVVGAFGYDSSAVEAGQPDREHIARHDPARVLREVAAKRRIVDELVEAQQNFEEGLRTSAFGEGEVCALQDAARALASVYADHPDYDPNWAM